MPNHSKLCREETNLPSSGEGNETEFWRLIFGNDHPVEIEIGPGTGTFILPAARARPQINFFGIEHSRGRAWRLQSAIETKGIRNALVINADAACIVGTLVPADSVAAYHVYFPDPWWKRRHHRRRLFTPAFAAALARTLLPGGRVYLATDVEEVLQLGLRALHHCEAFARDEHIRSPRLGLTAFERKGIARGAAIHEATLVRNGFSPHPHPLPFSDIDPLFPLPPGALPTKSIDLPPVIPAEAGIHGAGTPPPHLDTRFRGYDGIGSVPSPTPQGFWAKPPPGEDEGEGM